MGSFQCTDSILFDECRMITFHSLDHGDGDTAIWKIMVERGDTRSETEMISVVNCAAVDPDLEGNP